MGKTRLVITIKVLLCMVISLFFTNGVEAGEGPAVSADAAILMDANTGQVLYAKNACKKRPPASTTKVMTALIALERGRLEEKVTVSSGAALTEGSSMYLKAGEVFTVRDLLYGALLNSGNDACVAIAEHIAGSKEKFAVLMNVKALALGAVNSNFVNPHGLPDQQHYTCAYDLALIARKALVNQTFSQIVSTRSKLLEAENWDRNLQNTNKLLWKYIWADGVKTGTTSAAGQCLISSASKGSRQLVAVVLHSGDRWSDSIRMFEYGFNNYEYFQVAVSGETLGRYRVQNGVKEDLAVTYGSDLGLLVPVSDEKSLEKRIEVEPYPAAPVKKGQVLGSAKYYVGGEYAGSVSLVAGEDVEVQGPLDILIKWLKTKIIGIFGHYSAI